MQDTALPGSNTTRWTGYRGKFFSGEFSLFHLGTDCHSTQPRNCSILNNTRKTRAHLAAHRHHASIFLCPTAAFILFARRNLVAAITVSALITRKSHLEW